MFRSLAGSVSMGPTIMSDDTSSECRCVESPVPWDVFGSQETARIEVMDSTFLDARVLDFSSFASL